MIPIAAKQVWGIMRLETRRVFLSRMSLWLYLLAFAPLILLLGLAAAEVRQYQRLQRIPRDRYADSKAMDAIYPGMAHQQAIEILGRPYEEWSQWRGRPWIFSKFTDGKTDLTLVFVDERLEHIITRQPASIQQYIRLLASVYNWYYLRLAVFFGCVWVFSNLFRGQILDKTIHFYLLCPVRREVLMAGKYIAGLAATVLIFNASLAMQWATILWSVDKATVAGYMADRGWHQLLMYSAITTLACVGYGSLFTTVGLLFRNPIVPTAAILVWEHINQFLPAALKRLGMIHYLLSLCPVDAGPQQLPPLISLLIRPAEPASPPVALAWIIALSALMLGISCVLARRLQVNYATD